MITSAANTLILNTVLASTINTINIISLRNTGGEFFRKAVTNTIVVSAVEKLFTFYLSESEGNGNIMEIGLHGNGSTTTLGSGTCYATQALTLTKDNTQSLSIDWNVEVTV